MTIAVPDQTGAARMLVNFATALRDRDHEVLVVHGPPPTGPDGRSATVLDELDRAAIDLRPVARLRRPFPPVVDRQVAKAASRAEVIVGFNQRDRATAAMIANEVVGRDFDLILAMDGSNLSDLRAAAPANATADVRLFHSKGLDIPDPYYGGNDGFEYALQLIEAGCHGLLSHVQKQLIC